MKVLVLGGGGYIGRVICDRLRYEDYELDVVDLFTFSSPAEVATIAKVRIADTRNLTAGDFAGVDVVLDLAAISNDPSGELNPALTREVNAEARIRAAGLAKAMGVERYVLFSSCSVYGANDAVVDEAAPLNPLTEYARSNVAAERDVLALADAGFCATALRLATAFGLSPSMRFDLVVNTMALSVFETGRLVVTGGGEQYRPLVHVGDVAQAASALLVAPPAAINGETFNLAHVNLRMRDVAAEVLKGVNRPVEMVVDAATIDHRNYRVDATKAERAFGFRADRTIAGGVAAIFKALDNGTVVQSPLAVRLNGYRALVARMAL